MTPINAESGVDGILVGSGGGLWYLAGGLIESNYGRTASFSPWK
jgi:hypothetical protein